MTYRFYKEIRATDRETCILVPSMAARNFRHLLETDGVPEGDYGFLPVEDADGATKALMEREGCAGRIRKTPWSGEWDENPYVFCGKFEKEDLRKLREAVCWKSEDRIAERDRRITEEGAREYASSIARIYEDYDRNGLPEDGFPEEGD